MNSQAYLVWCGVAMEYWVLCWVFCSQEYKKIKIGSWEKLTEGKDAALITYGSLIEKAYKIKEKLYQKGLSYED